VTKAAAHGELAHGQVMGADSWGLKLRPHAMMRAKRWFPRGDQSANGVLVLRDTLEVARDLEAFHGRFPLDMTPEVAAQLAERAREHRQRDQVTRDILSGYTLPDPGKAPARTPRVYQQQAADLAHVRGSLLLGDDVGLGKTFSSLLVLAHPDALPAVVVVQTHLPRQWLAELSISLPWLLGHIVTSTKVYDPATRKDCAGRTPDVLIIPYSKLAGWADHLAGWPRTVIFDEVQELRRGTESMKGQAAARVAYDATHRMGLSATPVYNYADEIHSIMDILAPGVLGSREEFLREWGGGVRGLQRHSVVANPRALGDYLRSEGLMLRRTREDVHRELPEPLRIYQPVDTDNATIDQVAGDVAAMARLLLDDTSDTRQRWRAAGEIDWRIRQATGVAKAPYVAEFVKLLLESEQRIVLWGWHREVYDIWLDRLSSYGPVLYTGSESPQVKHQNAAAFIAGEARVLIMSLRSGSGLDGLQKACSVGVFGELDWSPAQHHQCTGRLARDGQESTVVAYYMVSDDGTDPHMADILGIKQQQSEPLMNPDVAMIQPLGNPINRARQIARDVLGRVGGLRPQREALIPESPGQSALFEGEAS
jgi:hypothetical protein